MMGCRTKLMKAIPSPILFVTKIPSGDNHDLVGVQKDNSSVGERRVWLLIYYTEFGVAARTHIHVERRVIVCI